MQHNLLVNPEEFKYSFKYTELEALAYKKTLELQSINCKGFSITLHVYKMEYRAGLTAYGFGIKIPIIGNMYDRIKVTHKISLVNPDNNQDSKSLVSQDYSFSNEHNYGPGPFSATEAKITEDDFKKYVKNNKVEIIVRINQIQLHYSEQCLAKRVYEKVCPESVKDEAAFLDTEIKSKQAQIIQFTEALKVIEKEKSLRKEEIAQSELDLLQVEKEHGVISNVNMQCRSKITSLRERVMILDKKISLGNTREFFKDFKPTDFKLEDLNTIQLKELLSRLSRLQMLINNHILEEENCGICLEKRSSVAIQPCGHLRYCVECANDVVQQGKEPQCSFCQTAIKSLVAIKF